ncbi:MAG: hypothetical protein JEY99_03405 [Spirochaetales bacterium]|nr:hypothetical protein [Spirochaetales bacterium]
MKQVHTLTILSVIILILSLFTSILGIIPGNMKIPESERSVTSFRGEVFEYYGEGLYSHETVSYAVQAKAQDWVTIVLGIPLLLTGLLLFRRGSFRGLLLLTGTLGYFLYTYISYCFLVSYNRLFLLYVILFAVSLYGFIISFVQLFKGDISAHFPESFPRKSLGIFFILTGVMLLFLWLGRIIPSMDGNTPPFGLEIYTTLVIQAMDLALIVPAAVISGMALLQKKNLGYGLGAVIVVKGITMFTAVSLMGIFQYRAGVVISIAELFIFPIPTLINLFFAFLLFKSVKN